MPEPHDTLTSFASALLELLSDEAFRYANPGEQAVTNKLCRCMVPLFPDWNVCAEWDRKEQEQKMLYYGWNDKVEKLRRIRPDIIVHNIGIAENLLVVEAKRAENRNDARDKAKLVAMTNGDGGYSYEVGVRIVLNLRNATIPDCEVFTGGESNPDLTAFLRDQLPTGQR